MANDYAPKQFLRHVQIALLQEYFTQRTMLGDVGWNKLDETEIEPIYAAWHGLAERIQKEVESDFRRVHAMGAPEGTTAIIEEGRFHELDLTPDLAALDGHLNKAFWTFLKHSNVFEVAERLHRADHLNSRYWRGRKDIPKKKPDLRPEALDELASAVAAYFWEQQGAAAPASKTRTSAGAASTISSSTPRTTRTPSSDTTTTITSSGGR